MSISISKFVRLLKSGTGFECIVDGGDFQLGVYVKDVELCDLDENLLCLLYTSPSPRYVEESRITT